MNTQPDLTATADAAFSELLGASHEAVEGLTFIHNLGAAGRTAAPCVRYAELNRELMRTCRRSAKAMQACLASHAQAHPEQVTPRLRDLQKLFGTLADDLLRRLNGAVSTETFGEIEDEGNGAEPGGPVSGDEWKS